PKAHHFFIAWLAPTNCLCWVGIERVIRRIVKICRGDELGALWHQELMLQEICLLPAEVVFRNIEQNFAATARINGFGGHALTTKVHVSGISNGHDVFGKDEARSYFVVSVARRNEKPVIPDLVLRHAVGDRS